LHHTDSVLPCSDRTPTETWKLPLISEAALQSLEQQLAGEHLPPAERTFLVKRLGTYRRAAALALQVTSSTCKESCPARSAPRQPGVRRLCDA
jgi:hypothetical protein